MSLEPKRMPLAHPANGEGELLLSCVVGTFNRADRLQGLLDSVAAGTRCRYEMIVVDGGSTDGTADLLKSRPEVTPVFQPGAVGVGRSYNEGFAKARGKYVCYLADDIEVVSSTLDQAVQILEKQPEIGMVGLKMKDVIGPWKDALYMGGLSAFGILNCNHGLLPTQFLKALGYFSEEYYSFLEDVDLTAKVLCAGKRVVMTKGISVLHYRDWAVSTDADDQSQRMKLREDGHKLYRAKFSFLTKSLPMPPTAKARILGKLVEAFYRRRAPATKKLGLNQRDWQNLAGGHWISPLDPILNVGRPYHLAQTLPRALLESNLNPCRSLLDSARRKPVGERSPLAASGVPEQEGR